MEVFPRMGEGQQQSPRSYFGISEDQEGSHYTWRRGGGGPSQLSPFLISIGVYLNAVNLEHTGNIKKKKISLPPIPTS